MKSKSFLNPLLIILMSIYNLSTFGQAVKPFHTPYYDALTIRDSLEYYNSTKQNTPSKAMRSLHSIEKLIALYTNYTKIDSTNENALIAEIDANPYLKNLIPHDGVVTTISGSVYHVLEINQMSESIDVLNFSQSSTTLPSPNQPLGGFDLSTAIVNGVADIMIERAKEELTIAFFDRFQKFIQDNQEFQAMFPLTTTNIKNLLDFSYNKDLQTLRKGFLEDLKKLPLNLDDVISLPKYSTLLKNHDEIKITIHILRMVHDLETGASNVANVIDDLSKLQEWQGHQNDSLLNNLGSVIKTAAIFSNSLTNSDKTKIWLSAKEIAALVKNDTLLNLFVGLQYQQMKTANIKFTIKKTSKKLSDIILAATPDIILWKTKISEFSVLAKKTEDSFNQITDSKKTKEITNDDINKYIGLSIDIIDYSLSIVKIFDSSFIQQDYASVARKANGLYKDIYTENYTQAVNDAIDVLKETCQLNPGIHKADFDKIITVVEEIKPYALFAANMALAKDEADVKAALENIILPAGSAEIKKHAIFNISLQSYLGFRLNPKKHLSPSQDSWHDRWGITAPIGFAFSWGLNNKLIKGSSISLFATVLDIGAIVDYKLNATTTNNGNNSSSAQTTVSKSYQIQWQQIFAPGAYLVFGLPWKLPVSIGAGAQYGPGLATVFDDGTTGTQKANIRGSIFLAADIPFLNLYNKTKIK